MLLWPIDSDIGTFARRLVSPRVARPHPWIAFALGRAMPAEPRSPPLLTETCDQLRLLITHWPIHIVGRHLRRRMRHPHCRASVQVAFGNGGRYSASLTIH
jgi:hypothetical protein